MHNLLFRYFTSYKYPLTIIAIVCITSFIIVNNETNTSGIVVSEQSLLCDDSIEIQNAENAENFLENLADYNRPSIQSIICTVDKAYNGSEDDKQAVQKFIQTKLSSWPMQRSDIKDYFVQKISSTN